MRSILLLAITTVCMAAGVSPRIDAAETERMFLSGRGADDAVNWEFFCTAGRNSGFWTNILVPSCWELQGFGAYNYGHARNPASEQGLYRRSFHVPSEWQDKDVQIVFEGSMTDTEVKVNGSSAGPIHQGAFYQFRYNIGGLLKYGATNLLEVTVSKRSSNASINTAERDADFWIFGGIFRPVLLEVRPQQSLQRVAIDAKAGGELTFIAHGNNISEGLAINAWVEDSQARKVGETLSAPIRSGESTARLTSTIPGVTAWTMEWPTLYHLVVELRRGPEVLHRIRERFGFRTVEVRPGDGLYLNGVKIRLKGINRHVFHPDHGRTSSRSFSEEAVRLIKGLNMNSLRMSHYPPDKHLLEVCDEQGLLVIDELTGWQRPPYDTATARRLVRQMIERDVNHPSVILWANGNEGGWNTEVDGDFALHDPQERPVIHPGSNFGGDIAAGGIDTTHYPTYSTLLNKLNGANLYQPTEFLHGLYDGGHGAGLQDYWNAMRNSPRGVGGFLWVFADEGVRRTDQGGRIDNDGNHAPDGIVGPYHEKKPSYDAVREIWSPIVLTTPSISPVWDGLIEVLNDYYFTSLDCCRFRWEFGTFPTLKNGPNVAWNVHANGEIAGPPTAPQTTGTFKIPLPAGWQTNDALRLTAFDPHGLELRQWTWLVRKHGDIVAANLPQRPQAAAALAEDSDSITLVGGAVRVMISKSTGRIAGVSRNGDAIGLGDGPRIVGASNTLTRLTRESSGSEQIVTATYDGDQSSVRYTMRGDGWMRIDYTLSGTSNQPNIGITFDYPEERITGMRWLGGGPQPVWKNRLAGAMLGVWEKRANNPIPGQSYTADPVFRGYHSDVHWCVLETTEGRIQFVHETPDLFLRVLSPANGVRPQHTQFNMPAGQISVLHAISPIGNKFHATGVLGPMSAVNAEPGSYSGSFWLNVAGSAPRAERERVAPPF